MLQIGLLGTLQVVHEGVHVTPSAPKVRQVLALLALRANATVPLHQLVEELWEEHPPSSAATTLQTYIYQLRKLPGLCDQHRPGPAEDGGAALRTTPGGYRLAVSPDCMDAQRFGELAARGRVFMEKGSTAEAADLMQRALAVWRGPALSDVAPGPVTGIDALRLEEQRYEVLEERLDADLLLGRHHRLVSELTGLAADNPTREGLHAKLMLSLYRAGRRPEALEVFQRIRRVLARELGLEPCAELQRLHQQVLAGDRGLDLPGGRTTVHAPRPGASPMTLPADSPLVGRDDDLRHVGRVLSAEEGAGGPQCVAVAGPPGAGTTAFTVHLAHRLGDSFPDGRLYASFGKGAAPLPVEEVLAGLLEAVGHQRSELPPHRAGRARMFRNWTEGRRVLLVVDDVATTEQVADLLPAGSGSAALVAGYRRLYGSQFKARVDLPPLGHERSLELFLDALGRGRGLDDPRGLHTMLDLCGDLPGPTLEAVGVLALRPHWSVRQLMDWLGRGRLSAVAQQRPHPFHHVVGRCARLEPRLREALAKLAWEAADDLTVEQAAAVLGKDGDETEEMLEELVELFLLGVGMASDPTTERFFQYRLAPLVRTALRAMQPAPSCV
ncbi:AfsR/SARP family transcriptional regulator [Streptomyces albidoflavus]|uniref:AfsR/SARP family transcriptional regulator n=1 Tax=Streptomyces albidoflavus TaxID=1886 RepID=UPI0033E8F51D